MSGRAPVHAIARIDGARWRGTGFVVRATDQRLLVLTAGHVADDAPGRVTFLATGLESPAAVVVRGASDWALLECVKPLADLSPIELDELDGPPATPFDTFGFPNLYSAARGGPLHGTVRRTAAGTIEPHCVELHDQKADQAKGISGAPCLVADVAIGLIHESLNFVGNIVAGTLRTVGARTIVDESGGLLALATDPLLPYLRLVKAPLASVDLDNLTAMATELELPPVAGLHADVMRRRVARGLLLAEPDKVARALVSVLEIEDVSRVAVRLLVQRESLWIRATTIAGVLDLVRVGGARALDAGEAVTARQLLRRAAWYRNYAERWHNRRHCVVVVPKVDSPAAVVEAFEKAAMKQFQVATRDLLKAEVAKRTVFAILHRVVPRAVTTAALAVDYAPLRLVFLSVPRQQHDPAAPPEIEWLVPELADGDEQAWRQKCTDAREFYRNNAALEINDDAFDLVE